MKTFYLWGGYFFFRVGLYFIQMKFLESMFFFYIVRIFLFHRVITIIQLNRNGLIYRLWIKIRFEKIILNSQQVDLMKRLERMYYKNTLMNWEYTYSIKIQNHYMCNRKTENHQKNSRHVDYRQTHVSFLWILICISI